MTHLGHRHQPLRRRVLAAAALVLPVAHAQAAGAATPDRSTAIEATAGQVLTFTPTAKCSFDVATPTPVLRVWASAGVVNGDPAPSGGVLHSVAAASVASGAITFVLPPLTSGEYVYGFLKATEMHELPGGAAPCDPSFYVDGGQPYGVLTVTASIVDSDGDGLNDDQEKELGTDPKDPDSDDDGLTDGAEALTHKTNPLNPDTDGGGVDDGDEVEAKTDPLKGADDDGDGDGFPNSFEICDKGEALGTDCTGTDPLVADSDGDGLSDSAESCARPGAAAEEEQEEQKDVEAAEHGAEEAEAKREAEKSSALLAGSASLLAATCHGTDPLKADTDGGGVPDGQEVSSSTNPLEANDDDSDGDGLNDDQEKELGTDPGDADTDDDGLPDGEEVNDTKTDPRDADTDDDRLSDGDEVDKTGTDPNDADTDGGGVKDGDEVDAGTDPLKGSDDDSDGDGLSDDLENDLGTDPDDADTDGDGLDDGEEFRVYGTSALKADTDGDGMDDGDEVASGTDPLVAPATLGRRTGADPSVAQLAFTGSEASAGLWGALLGAVGLAVERRRRRRGA